MALKINDRSFLRDVVGMPSTHAVKFLEVSRTTQCIILCRATGPTCLQLLKQGYDTKGFRVHAKSCDWGPMAGFVLRDPRLNKYGYDPLNPKKANYNQKEHAESETDRKSGAGWGSSTTPLKIYSERVDWLVRNGIIHVASRGSGLKEGTARHPAGLTFNYVLARDRTNPELWKVLIDNTRNPVFLQETGHANPVPLNHMDRGRLVRMRQPWAVPKGRRVFEPMLAVTNPRDHRSWTDNDFRNAITGDYDLFALWPFDANDYDPHGKDRRLLGTSRGWSDRELIEVLERNFTEGGQGTKLGNMTDRLYEVCQFLNSAIGATRSERWGPFPNRNVAWHSDEAARPFVDEVDLPIIALDGRARRHIGIETIRDFQTYVDQSIRAGVGVNLAEGWVLDPDPNTPNRLGARYRGYQATVHDSQIEVPDWYNH